MPRSLFLALVLVACSSTATTTLAPETPATSPSTTPAVTTVPAPATEPSTPEVPATVSPATASVAELDLGGAVFDASRVERFRSSVEVVASADPDETVLTFASRFSASYQRQPAAVTVEVETEGAGAGDLDLTVIGIEDQTWLRNGAGPWQADPQAQQLLAVADVQLLSPAAVEIVLPVLDEVGEETVGGRPAIHLQGDLEALLVFLSAAEIQDINAFSEVTSGSIDLWLDRAGFVSRAEYRFGGVLARSLDPQYYRASFELFDFDGDFAIEPPV